PSFKEIFYRKILPDLKQRGKTLIVISHDDRYFDAADQLVRMEDGKIVNTSGQVAAA
ncbi:MAG: cyclic peptide transporter, partial [Deltaproteobacteria bacterium]